MLKKLDLEKLKSVHDMNGIEQKNEKIEIVEELEEIDKKRTVKVFKTMTTAKKMKILSEQALENSDLPFCFKEGESYHCFSFGDVDSLTYLKWIIRQQNIEYLALSTWCMAIEDCHDIEKWIDKGSLKHVDFYVGEIFKNGYRGVYDELKKIARKTNGRVARFRNHSKVMIIIGERFNALIESSANMNTNPRCENTVVTIDHNLALDYKELFDDIKSFDKGFEEWKPYELKGFDKCD